MCTVITCEFQCLGTLFHNLFGRRTIIIFSKKGGILFLKEDFKGENTSLFPFLQGSPCTEEVTLHCCEYVIVVVTRAGGNYYNYIHLMLIQYILCYCRYLPIINSGTGRMLIRGSKARATIPHQLNCLTKG